MSLIIKSKFYNKSNNVVIDYSEKNFVRQQKEIKDSGTLCRKGDKLSFKIVGALNTSNNSNENTNYMNENRLVDLISIEKKDGPNFDIDCGEWSKDIIELLDQNATYFLYKGSTIENFMKDKHRYHVLTQGDIIKIGKIYLKVLHIKLINPNQKILRTSTNKDESENNNKSNNNINEEEDKEEQNKTNIQNNLIIERDINKDKDKTKTRNKKNRFPKSKTDAHKIKFEETKNNKIINHSMVMTQKLNLTQLTIDLNSINNENIKNIKNSSKRKKSRNKNDKKKKNSKSKNISKNKQSNNIQEIKLKNKICRICLSGETNPSKNPLICPCICKGSMKYIHYLCLKNWLNLKVESEVGPNNIETDRPTITYSTNDICCELCKSKFPDYVKHNGKLYNVSFYKPKYDQFLVLESVRNDNRRTKFIHIIPLNNYSMHRIGRLNNCDLSLPDSSISRVHCCFYIENNQLVLENNSKFGTKVLIQKRKLNMVYDYPLCIETQNTYLKIYLQRKFNLFSCCNSSTKSQIKMHPYQSQNQKGFDLFCSMVFKDDDEDDSDNEDKKEENVDENANLIENNNKEEEDKKEDPKNETGSEKDKKEDSKNETGSERIREYGKGNKEIKNIENDNETKKEEKNLINIKLNEDKNSEKEKDEKKEEKNLKNLNKNIIIETKNLDNKSPENKSESENNLISEEIKKEKEKEKGKLNMKKITINTNDIKENYGNNEFNFNYIKINQNKNFDLISNPENSNINNEFKISEVKNGIKFNKTMINFISNIDRDNSKIHNRETENPNDYLNQIESEESIEKEKKSIINNLFKNNEIQTLKEDINNINENKIEFESNINNDTENNKSNKSINLDKINNLSYKRMGDRLDNRYNISAVNNYDSIFGLIPNDKHETSLLFAPKHNKSIKFENYDIHFESEKYTNQKSSRKMWNKFNWNFK